MPQLYDPGVFWDERFRTLGYTGWADKIRYRYDQPLRLRAILRTLRKSGIRLTKDSQVLDIGCGTGDLIDLLSREGPAVTGIDISEEVVAAATARFKGNSKVKVLAGKVEETGFPPGSFDLITSVTVLQHVLQPEPFLAAVKKLCQALKGGGYIVLLEWGPKERPKGGISPHITWRSRQEWVAAFENEGCSLATESTYPEWGFSFLDGVRRLMHIVLRRKPAGQGDSNQQASPPRSSLGQRFRRSLNTAGNYLLLRLAFPLDHWLFIRTPGRIAEYRLFLFRKP